MGLSPLLCITPFGRPDPHLAAALARAGVPCAIDLGADPSGGAQALWTALDAAGSAAGRVGVLLQRDVDPALLAGAAFLILAPGMDAASYRGIGEIHAQVRDLSEARAALDSGATALIAKGSESGGRVGTRSTFILLQQLLESGALPSSVPIRGQGGIGPHTAAGCLAGGAAGFVLDSALALARESRLPAGLGKRLTTLDGSETVVVGEHRVLRRPDVTLADSFKDASAEEVAARIGADDLDQQLLPVGEDIGLASILAERYRTAGGIAHAVEAQALAAVEQASRQGALAPDAALAREHGCRFPVVQGPMTRVSDGAEFAAAVAEGGGLPFLALSLMDGDQVRSLVEATRDQLGPMPFGVGLLGFLPGELREKQLEVLRDLRPPFALIAGGRPSQARALEDLGTPTYLHVPSPGLLDLFLDQGARRFVFEGRECGGHVGPRSSYSLWEAQLQRLAGFEHPEELRILFAGGIHDERSAAMVAALAAPLVERGARVGVLMGSAYIFTDEAVTSGAIDEGYRQTAVACKGTELVETAPGHATRCAATPFVDAFRDERARLEESGAESRDMWATLERLNLGRLRIASKGLRRDAGELVTVGDEERAQTGMFMLGEVASLRNEAVTVLDLHLQVSEGACDFLVERARDLFADDDADVGSPMDIAIIGMAGIFPGASDLDSFWSNVVRGVDSLRDVDPMRWNPEIYCDPNGAPGESIPSPRGGFLDPVVLDPTKEGIPPKSMAAIEPVQLLSLEVARRALCDAGYATREFDRASTSVIFGAEGGNDLAGALGFRVLYKQLVGEITSELEACLPQHTEDTFPGVLANVIAGRIANRLDLGGFNYTVDAACASSLAALECGVQSLLAGTSSMVLVGGADLHNSVNDYMMFSSVQALSATGRSRPFDAEADGIVLGEAVGTVVLKRRADAERDGDRIYALVQSSAGSSDGKSLGMTAPRLEGQVRAMNRAYERLPYGPAQVGLVEAHGTGTVVGDRTELASMTQVFRADGAANAGCTLGSVKSQIGHTKCAAGIASLIKGALSLHHRILPSTLGINRPNRGYQADESPFEFRKASAPWPQPQGGPRVAGVSSFGFGGTNFHVVLEEYEGLDGPDSHLPVWPEELFLLRGAERGAAEAGMDALVECLDAEEPWTLRELAHATSRRGTGPVQIALLAKDTDQLAERLRVARSFEAAEGIWVRASDAPESAPRVAFLVPGQGSQYPGMLQQLFLAFPQLSDLLEQAGPLIADLFPAAAFDNVQRLAQRERLAQTERAQPALGLCGLAMGRLLKGVGVKPDWLGGHSYGELVALALAGALPEERLLELSHARAEAILSAVGDDPGTMAAVAASGEETAAALHGIDEVVLANLNSPRQTVISGPTDAVGKAIERLGECGFAARSIPVACAFHSNVVAGAEAAFAEYLRAFPIAPPSLPVFSNTTAAPHAADPELVRSALSEQIVRPVRFADQVQAMYDAGARIFVEVGPGRVLTGLVGKVLADQEVQVISTNESGSGDLSSFLAALAQLSVLGVELEPEFLFNGRTDGDLDLDSAPERTLAPLAWKVDGFRAIPVSGNFPPESLRPCATPPVEMVPRGSEAATASEVAAAPEDAAQATVLAYLKNVSDTLEAQRQVVLAYLGSAAPDLVRQVEAAQIPAPASAPQVKAEAVPKPTPAPTAGSADEKGQEPILELDQELLRIVSERTGYPEDMLDLDLDLEADLGIDSIKRIEILGALNNSSAMEVGTEEERDALVEQLASIKTLRGILEWIETQSGDLEDPESATGAAGDEHTEKGPAMAVEPEQPLRRYAPTLVDVPALNGNRADVSGRSFALTDDRGGVAQALARGLENLGARVRLMEKGTPMNGDGHLIHLAPLASDGGPDDVRALFALTQAAAPVGLESLCTATRSSGLAGGAAGFAKSYAKEHPNSRVRIVHLDPDSDPGVQAELLLAEICASDDTLEVSYASGSRQAVEAAPLLWSEPEEAGHSPLDSESVVLITGGARGIAGRVTTGLAQRFGCHFEVIGRSPLPERDEEARFSYATSLVDLRRALIDARSGDTPAEIDAAARGILGAREIRATLQAVRSAGGTVRYQSVDVRARRAFGKCIDQIYDERGRLDGVIHAAGVIEDKLLTQKTQESFDRVFDTKVLGAHTIAQHIREDLRFLVFFSSISGAFGNRGQADYAAANDHLDKLAHSLAKTHSGRILSINWGPWEGAGMVGADLQSEYERRGIGLIPLEGGVQALMRELGARGGGPSQVMLMNADPEQLR
ncbi:MAG: SDR family NAD(P)-dependent oxidoreductase [Planctomycetota bacterium]|nr:SDR family NAD(P)-dependent oxidoreductase [Planctomycetota bacterium]